MHAKQDENALVSCEQEQWLTFLDCVRQVPKHSKHMGSALRRGAHAGSDEVVNFLRTVIWHPAHPHFIVPGQQGQQLPATAGKRPIA